MKCYTGAHIHMQRVMDHTYLLLDCRMCLAILVVIKIVAKISWFFYTYHHLFSCIVFFFVNFHNWEAVDIHVNKLLFFLFQNASTQGTCNMKFQKYKIWMHSGEQSYCYLTLHRYAMFFPNMFHLVQLERLCLELVYLNVQLDDFPNSLMTSAWNFLFFPFAFERLHALRY